MKEFIKNVGSPIIIMDDIEAIEFKKDKLPPGLYELIKVGNPMLGVQKGAFKPITCPDNLIKFKSGVFDKVIRSVDEFFSEDVITLYKGMRLAHKMGLI